MWLYGDAFASTITEILIDLIESSTTCGCCDNNIGHQELIHRSLKRTDLSLWPISVSGRRSNRSRFSR